MIRRALAPLTAWVQRRIDLAWALVDTKTDCGDGDD